MTIKRKVFVVSPDSGDDDADAYHHCILFSKYQALKYARRCENTYKEDVAIMIDEITIEYYGPRKRFDEFNRGDMTITGQSTTVGRRWQYHNGRLA